MWLGQVPWAGRYWALPFLTVLAPSARYYRQRGRHHKKLTDWARQMVLQLRRWLPQRSPGAGGRRRLRQARVPAALPEYVKADCRRHPTAQGRVPVPARATAAARPDRAAPMVGARLPSPTAVLDDPATQWIPYRATGSDGSTARVELASGVALWYHGGPPRLPIRWVVIRYLEEPPRALCFAMHRHRGGTPADTAVVSAAVAGRGDPVSSTGQALLRSCGLTWAWKPSASGRNEPSPVPPPRSLACSAW